MDPLIRNFRYRPEIDGLRAIAVVAVVLFHARIGLRGGYIGVDVFFVISGFLITSLIVKDLQDGKFSLANFWERRVRRIIPAAVVMVLATLVTGWFLLMPADYVLLGHSAVWQAVFGANFHFWLNTNYFAGPAEEQALLHTWSLAVEEQFYLLFPLILFGLSRLAAFRRRGPLLAILILAFLASLAVSIYSVPRNPSAAFYLLPSRAWELLAGSIIALLPAPSLGRVWREVLCWLALLLVLVPCFHYTRHTPFPGLAALPPCLGAALFIWATARRSADTSSVPSAARLLSSRPVVFIGLISYSLYLWHWPLFAFSTYIGSGPMPRGYSIAMVGLSLVLAVLSWRFVETPFRKRRVCATRKSVFAFGACAIAAVTGLGIWLQFAAGFPQRLSPEAQRYACAQADSGIRNELNVEDVRMGKLLPLGANQSATPDAPVTWLVWGDSHATAALPAFDAFFKEQHVSGQAATHSATAPVLNYCNTYWPAGAAFNDAVLAHVKAHRIPNVVLVAYWDNYRTGVNPELPGNLAFDAALILTVQKIVQAGSRPWIFLDVPTHEFDVPRALARSVCTRTAINPNRTKPDPNRSLPGNDPQLITKLRAAGASVIDPRPAFLSDDGSHYVIVAKGTALYSDSNHLSTRGAKLLLLPLLRKLLAQIP